MYEVLWLPVAIQELAALWKTADADFRRQITSAVVAIDADLRPNPWTHGESRGDGRRVHFRDPLGVLYEMERMTASVMILHVWNTHPN